jgi:hypothetical protein
MNYVTPSDHGQEYERVELFRAVPCSFANRDPARFQASFLRFACQSSRKSSRNSA